MKIMIYKLQINKEMSILEFHPILVKNAASNLQGHKGNLYRTIGNHDRNSPVLVVCYHFLFCMVLLPVISIKRSQFKKWHRVDISCKMSKIQELL